jgi:hypothetical protein
LALATSTLPFDVAPFEGPPFDDSPAGEEAQLATPTAEKAVITPHTSQKDLMVPPSRVTTHGPRDATVVKSSGPE